MLSTYKIYTDGSALETSPNYYGGWGYVVVSNDDKKIYEEFGMEYPSTNNKMELTAILKAIEYIEKNHEFGNKYIIYTDSNYSLQSVTTWVKIWIRNGWKNSKKQLVANKELISNIYDKLLIMPYISIEKVKGHNGNEWNEYADYLATTASDNLKIKLMNSELENFNKNRKEAI